MRTGMMGKSSDPAALTRRSLSRKVDWGLLAVYGVVVPTIILTIRLKIMCPFLGVKAFEFLPLSDTGSGCQPHWFLRVMHDLTHPALLLGGAVVLTGLAVRSMVRPMSGRAGGWLMWGLMSLHLLYFAAYGFSMFLPMSWTEQILPVR